jgi:hypothetical protein
VGDGWKVRSLGKQATNAFNAQIFVDSKCDKVMKPCRNLQFLGLMLQREYLDLSDLQPRLELFHRLSQGGVALAGFLIVLRGCDGGFRQSWGRW